MTDAIRTETVPGDPWARNIWALTLIVFVAFVGFQFFSPFLPLYVHELGVPDARRVALWSGVLAAVTPAISGVLGPLFGRLADRYGRKLMLIRPLHLRLPLRVFRHRRDVRAGARRADLSLPRGRRRRVRRRATVHAAPAAPSSLRVPALRR